MPKLTACSTLAFSLSSFDTALKHISDYGFKHVEIAEMLTHSKHFPIDTVDPFAVRKLLDKYTLTPIAANVSIAFLKSGPSAYRKLPVEEQSAAETDEIRMAKQDRVFYRLHVESEA
jgi:sugar phosphate isomerase/epimerase